MKGHQKFNVWLSDELMERMRRISYVTGTSLARLARLALEKDLDRQEEVIVVLKQLDDEGTEAKRSQDTEEKRLSDIRAW